MIERKLAHRDILDRTRLKYPGFRPGGIGGYFKDKLSNNVSTQCQWTHTPLKTQSQTGKPLEPIFYSLK